MSIKINGQRGAKEQPIKFGQNESGPYAIRTWHGTRNEVFAEVPSVLAGGGTYEIRDTFTGTKVELEARFSNNSDGSAEVPIDTWELFAAEVEKDILESDISAITNLPKVDREMLRKLQADPSQPGSFLVPDAETIYRMMLKGVKSTLVQQPSVRHTQTVSNTYLIKASLANVGKIFTSAQLGTVEGFPGTVLFALPNDVAAIPTDPLDPVFNYGWRKKHPTVRGSARQKTQIEQEWIYGLWAYSPIQPVPWYVSPP